MENRIALIGFVNTEEILADTLKRQSPQVQVDGFELFPNDAFGRLVDNRFPLYHFEKGELLSDVDAGIALIKSIGYSAVNVGPDTASIMTSDVLAKNGINFIGPRTNELEIETDKTKISEIFPEKTGVLPMTRIIDVSDLGRIDKHIEAMGGEVVAKFVGDYTEFYQDSEYRRVRLPREFSSRNDLRDFLNKSIESSGQAILQEYIDGQQFSYSCLVDGNGGIFPLGENIFYKNRYEGDLGPFCDGTGSVSINNTLPDLLKQPDTDYIKHQIIEPYLSSLNSMFGRRPKTFLNVDLVKSKSGRIYLVEINNRQPGGHTMSTLLSGLNTPLAEVLQAAQEDRLSDITPQYKPGASLAVTIFPDISPNDFDNKSERPIMRIPKLRPDDVVRHYTGWVDVIEETADDVTIQSNLTATLIVNNHAPTIQEARTKSYKRVSELVTKGFTYRTDIGARYI